MAGGSRSSSSRTGGAGLRLREAAGTRGGLARAGTGPGRLAGLRSAPVGGALLETGWVMGGTEWAGTRPAPTVGSAVFGDWREGLGFKRRAGRSLWSGDMPACLWVRMGSVIQGERRTFGQLTGNSLAQMF